MISFIGCLVFLIVGYFVYGKVVEKIFKIEKTNVTPAFRLKDGVDFIPMKGYKIFIIQFLNIAGLGPIFGAIMGAKYGTASFLWITLGSVFIGAVHDYIPGMISLRKNGETLPEIHGLYLGKFVREFMRIFMIVLTILVGVVFVSGPAQLLTTITPDFFNLTFWIIVIFIYYLLATLLPIDKIIGKIYPIFGVFLLIMALGILFSIFYFQPELPEFWDGLGNQHPQKTGNPIFPIMFITIACGAISGFHSTQSTLMSRCMTNEKQGHPVFFGAMITEGIVALIWAAAATYFFHHNEAGKALFVDGNPTLVVQLITQTWMGRIGAVLAVLGVIFAPITTGDTAFRMGRIMIAELFHFEQKSMKNRLIISIPIFLVSIVILVWSITDKQGFDIIWRYFAWGNQFLAMVTLWASSVYLVLENKFYWITFIPAIFMTMVTSTFIFIVQNQGFGLNPVLSYSLGFGITNSITILFWVWKKRFKKNIFIH
ncbi:MAG: carbon starvation protein [Bacteroidetes bacterium]|nr:carbon starvation protein [Bacteroidota bacterium]